MTTKSPFKAAPLRTPGQSLQDEINTIIDDQVMPSLLMAFFMVVLTGYNWWFWYTKTIPSPLIMTIVTVIFISFTTWKVITSKRKLKLLKLARDGEKIVGQFLDCLREDGYTIYHDIIGDSFNIDHVAIGPTGVYTIETKSNSKPANGEARIIYDGQSLLVNGFRPDRNPIVQAKAQANWIKELLLESTGKAPTVKPVVLYPGWFIETPKGMKPEVWVLNPKALPKYLDNASKILTPEEQNLFSYHLARYIRSKV